VPWSAAGSPSGTANFVVFLRRAVHSDELCAQYVPRRSVGARPPVIIQSGHPHAARQGGCEVRMIRLGERKTGFDHR